MRVEIGIKRYSYVLYLMSYVLCLNMRHNNIRAFEATLLKEVCRDVQMEPIYATVRILDFLFFLALGSFKVNC